MTLPATPSDAALAQAQGELDRLNARIAAMRAVLAGLLQEVVAAEARVAHANHGLLVEANERLVVSALLSREHSDSALQALDEASRAAEHDALTGLPQRRLLLDRFHQGAAQARREGTRLAVLFIDLDNFKHINDELGHPVGDTVLQRVAQRLQAAVRAGDTVSRHGGDEFVVLLAGLTQPQDAALIATKLIAAVGHPDGECVAADGLSASVGIAVFPDDGDEAALLITLADAAMYASKRRASGGFAFHGQAPGGAPAA